MGACVKLFPDTARTVSQLLIEPGLVILKQTTWESRSLHWTEIDLRDNVFSNSTPTRSLPFQATHRAAKLNSNPAPGLLFNSDVERHQNLKVTEWFSEERSILGQCGLSYLRWKRKKRKNTKSCFHNRQMGTGVKVELDLHYTYRQNVGLKLPCKWHWGIRVHRA